MQTEILKDYVSRDDLAAKLGITVKTLVRWQNDGKGPPVTYLGRAPFYSIPSFEKWLKAQERAAGRATSANAAYRRTDSDIDALVKGVLLNGNSRGQKLRHVRLRNETKREEANDYFKIRAMLPANFPDRDDVVSAIFEDLLTGALRREDVRARVKSYITAHNRMFPTKYAKFGDSPLVSLDEVIFDGGSASRGDTVSRGLWD